jgi:hypothetical protein
MSIGGAREIGQLTGDSRRIGGMMVRNFEDRQKGFEAEFVREQDLSFRVAARRNKLLGLWAAEQLGLTGAEVEGYAKTVVAADFEAPGDGDVVAKLLSDFAARGLSVAEGDVRSELARAAAEARKQLVEP